LDPGDGGEQAREARFERRSNVDDRYWDSADREQLDVTRAIREQRRTGRLPETVERADHDGGGESKPECEIGA
jgi:hypothetical protein